MAVEDNIGICGKGSGGFGGSNQISAEWEKSERNDHMPQVVRKKQFGDKCSKKERTVSEQEKKQSEFMRESQYGRNENRDQERNEGNEKQADIEEIQKVKNENETRYDVIQDKPQWHRNISGQKRMSGSNAGCSFRISKVEARSSGSQANVLEINVDDIHVQEDRKNHEVSQPHCSLNIKGSTNTNEIPVDNEQEGPNLTDVDPHVRSEAVEIRTKGQPNLSLEDRKAIRSCQLICAWFLFCMIFGIPMSFMVNYADKDILGEDGVLCIGVITRIIIYANHSFNFFFHLRGNNFRNTFKMRFFSWFRN